MYESASPLAAMQAATWSAYVIDAGIAVAGIAYSVMSDGWQYWDTATP
jgi:hypothetical protein